ncbi:MAG TPA: hypothetical protein VNG11_07475 [Chloroflexota bacterium]|nr:hypothetical protein [Chloroflexota bacterium]
MPIPLIVRRTAEPQTLDEIRDWHGGIVDALVEQRASIHYAIRQSAAVAPRFVGMTEGEVDAHYDADRRELDRLTVLNLVASAEGTLKVDYFHRVAKRLKDSLSLAYQKWHKTLSANKQLRPDFDDGGILDVLKETKVMDNNIIGRYRECLRARHWLGHGRYWSKPVEVDRLDPDDVYDRADALLRAMPA